MTCPLYTDSPFDEWHAWIDLCLLADDTGTIKTSLKALKNRWKWKSEHRVRDYLGTVSGTGLGTVFSTPRKGTLIRINPDYLGIKTGRKKDTSGTDSGTDSGIEELTSKEVGRGSSLGITPPNNKKEREADDDEYGYE